MRLLVIDTVNYIDYPTGGVMAFYRTMLPPCGNSLILVGITTDVTTPVGKWIKRDLNGIEFDFYSIKHVIPRSQKPLVPRRITDVLLLKRSLTRALKTAPPYDYIFTQSHEVLHNLPKKLLGKTCFVSPGLTNPLSISRYSWARVFARIYDRFYLMPKVAKVRWHLAAADQRSKEDFARRSGGYIKPNDIITFPTRYNDNIFKVLPKNECRDYLKIDKEKRIFVTVGRLNWFKGWKLMIDAVSIFNKKEGNCKLFFIGDGEDDVKIKEYIRGNDLVDVVFLVGKIDPSGIAKYLNAADVFLMGSFAEGWSTTLVEACACGVPCVVTEFSSAKEMIQDGKNGYVVCNREPVFFAEYLVKALGLNRLKVQEYNKKYKSLAQSRIMEEIDNILNNDN